MGCPLWGFLIWRGRLGRGFPKGETKAGEERRGLCLPGSGAWAGGGYGQCRAASAGSGGQGLYPGRSPSTQTVLPYRAFIPYPVLSDDIGRGPL